MGIYRTTIAGRRKPVLVRADNITKAKDRIVTSCELLNSDKLEEALTDGERVWKEGEDFPLDDQAGAAAAIAGEGTLATNNTAARSEDSGQQTETE